MGERQKVLEADSWAKLWTDALCRKEHSDLMKPTQIWRHMGSGEEVRDLGNIQPAEK